MTEQERIESIKTNGGRHLQNFKAENVTYDMCLAAVENDGYALEFVPEKFRNKKIYKAACKSRGMLLRFVPDTFIDKKICELSICSAGLALQYVPEELKTTDLCFKAVCNDSLAFQYTPPEILTPDFCAKVVKKKGIEWISSIPNEYKNSEFYTAIIKVTPEIFWKIPKKNRTAAICKVAIQEMGYKTTAKAVKKVPKIFGLLHTSLYDHDSCLEFVKSEYFLAAVYMAVGHRLEAIFEYDDKVIIDGNSIDLKKMLRFYDVCELAVQANPYILKSVPNSLITKELCELAVKANGLSFEYVPIELQTREMCELAVEKDSWNLEKIPDAFKTGEMCLKAVKEYGGLLEFIPETIKSYDMCKIAIVDEGSGLSYVPDRIFDKELALLAIKHARYSWNLLDEIPERLRDYDVCLAAVNRDGSNLEFVPEKVKNEQICLAAAKESESAAKFIPKALFTPEICLALTQNGALHFDEIPKECLTTEACIEAIRHGSRYGGTVIGEVPKELVTQEMCDLAIKISVWSLGAIPDEFVTEEILMYVAEKAPGRIQDNFPQRFRTYSFFQKMIENYPDTEYYINEYIR